MTDSDSNVYLKKVIARYYENELVEEEMTARYPNQYESAAVQGHRSDVLHYDYPRKIERTFRVVSKRGQEKVTLRFLV